MTTRNRKLPSLVGAALGLAVFLAVGLVPAMLYGGYAGVALAAAVLGAPVAGGGIAGAFVVLGLGLGVVVTGAFFAAAGAAAATAVAALLALTTPARGERPAPRDDAR